MLILQGEGVNPWTTPKMKEVSETEDEGVCVLCQGEGLMAGSVNVENDKMTIASP